MSPPKLGDVRIWLSVLRLGTEPIFNLTVLHDKLLDFELDITSFKRPVVTIEGLYI